MQRFGRWTSPITAERLAEKSTSLSQFIVAHGHIYFSQLLPMEKGRYSVFELDPLQQPAVATNRLSNQQFNARTRVHEYGGLSFAVTSSDVLYFVNFVDQNLYSVGRGQEPKQVTATGVRFAELSITSLGIVCVAEEHSDDQVANYLALIDPQTGMVRKLNMGSESDFVAYPTVLERPGSSKLVKLAWVTWQHPNMPWNKTELWTCDLLAGGECVNIQQVGKNHSFQQPRWDPNTGELVYLSDESGYWNFYRLNLQGTASASVLPSKAEFGDALWQLGMRTWDFCAGGMVAQMKLNGVASLVLIKQGKLKSFDQLFPLCSFTNVVASDNGDQVFFLAASPTQSSALFSFSLSTGKLVQLQGDEDENSMVNLEYISTPEHITFPTTNLANAHAFFYHPRNPQHTSSSTPPPLLLFLHGGPTSMCSNALKLPIQFWTSRGFAVADVNYRGSTGYGREYRQALERDTDAGVGNWGLVDVEDCIHCVEYLVQRGQVDATRVAIRGGSAGGFTTLACLANSSKVFAAGTSYYGVSDLLALASDTHKFESRYLDRLVGELPQHRDEYVKRSPISNLEHFSSPLLVLQGSEDKIVPQSQAEKMVHALRDRHLTVEYKLYPGEQHGFRKFDTLVDSLNRELAFYLAVFYPGE
ncbi:hypothetical protein BASA81_000369 [Batrachochytrium salamandrivorans]|nr:hypothetical protein BASA81_000369 [Batrachochytrium salamandrivorans]